MFTLEKFGEGRFDVLAENGMRAGSIVGGSDIWCAEVGNKVIGYLPNRTKAAEAIMKDRGIQGIYQQMQAIIESPKGLLQSYKDDFYLDDRKFIESWHCATSLIWVVRKSGTHIIALDMPFTKKEGEAILGAMHPDRTGSPWELYLVDVIDLKVKPVTETVARSLITRTPKFGIKNGFITSHGSDIAKIDMSLAQGYQQFDRRCNVTINCKNEPSIRTLAVLQRMAFIAVSLENNGDLFSAPATIAVFFEKKQLFKWEAQK